jgi:hypothetical protein
MMTSFESVLEKSVSTFGKTIKEPCRIESADIMEILEEKEMEFEREKIQYEDKMLSLEDEICKLNSENINSNRKISKLEF